MKHILALLTLSATAVAQPTVTAVLGAGSYTNNVAQGSVFVVRGTGLSPAGLVSAPSIPLPTTLNTVSISMKAVNGGAVVTPLMINTFNLNGVNQLVAVLPSNASLGAYDLAVANGTGVSPLFRTVVVARKPGIVTANSIGTGLAQATINGQLILDRTANQGKIDVFDSRSAHPGERVDLWGTGLGADLASDSGGSSGDQTSAAQIRVLINGAEVVPAYAGRASTSPGLDQIAFTLPSDVALSCTVDIQVSAGGVLSNAVTLATSTTDSCPAAPTVRINEVESNGGTPGDWVELYNPGPGTANLAGYVFRDNDNTHNYTLPTTAVIPAEGYYLLEEADFGFGLGSPDMARLFRPDGTLAESYSWTPHAATTYGRCPNGIGALTTTTSSTKGAANDCGSPVRINEVESDGGTPGDWVELFNPGTSAADVSGFAFRDNDDTHTYLIPAGTTIPPAGYLVLDEATFGFGLGSADSARLFDATGALIDSYAWTAHASTTYGRCPNGTGAFATTTVPTKGTANSCAGAVTFAVWPGAAVVQTADNANTFGGNLSGLIYEDTGTTGSGILWGIKNGPGTLYRLILNGTVWVPDTTNSWSAGKALRYPDGTGDPDSEGVTFAGPAASGGIYVSTERNNSSNATSRLSILRFDPAAAGSTLIATQEWNLTADLPVVGANLGLEAITWIPDTFLVSKGFFDEKKSHAYNPAEYPNHGTGLFFVGLEANGMVYAYALDHSAGGGYNKLATITTGLAGVMDLQFDRDLDNLWAVCDDTCQGRSVVLAPDAAGKFTVAQRFERPAGMPNLNNEGFAIAPASQCSGNTRPVYWADDTEDDGHAIRSGTLTCKPF